MSEMRDVVVVGGGPAGQKAAIQAVKLGQRVLVVERERNVGGSCVRRGTIPSKTLREIGVALAGLRRKAGRCFQVTNKSDLHVSDLTDRVEAIICDHEEYMARQLARNGVEMWHGRARFLSPTELEVESIQGTRRVVAAKTFVIASGSRPRNPSEIHVDHENVFDSDSILSLSYLPRSLAVIGSGVIASEYACIFQALGVRVLMIDSQEHSFSQIDPEIARRFLDAFEQRGGRFLARQSPVNVAWDGVSKVLISLESGMTLESEKVLYAKGRVGNTEELGVEAAGLTLTSRATLEVNEHFQTAVPHIYAVGDVIGAPSLASSAMDQGRRAVCHALGAESGPLGATVPTGIYTIPEIASVGLTENQALERFGGAVVGRARYDEIARGRISANEDGLLKLVADPEGKKLLGVQIVADGATELVHTGQMALVAGFDVDVFIQNVFNFPTYAEAYRVAALDIAEQRTQKRAAPVNAGER